MFAVSAAEPSRAGRQALATLTRAVVGLTVALLAVLAAPGLTAAQEQSDTNALQSITPTDGSTLDVAPTEIVLSFQQELDDDDVVTLIMQCGGLVQGVGPPERDDDGLVVTFPVPVALPKGACIMSWRLVDQDNVTLASDDSVSFSIAAEPVAAATTTVAGVTTPPANSVVQIPVPTPAPAADASSPAQGSSGGALWLGRLLSTLGVLALFGGLALIALGWPEGPEYVVTVRYLRAVWALAMVGTVLYLIAYAAEFNDSSFGAAVSPGAWLDLADAGWPGRGALLRFLLVAGSGWVAMRPERIIDPTTSMWAWGVPGAALVAIALSRVEGPVAWLGVLIGLGHVVASALWFGGVALVARVVLAGPGEEDLVQATRSFSRISTKALVAAVLTGLAQMMRLVGNPFGSGHGRVLLLKVLAVAALVAVALAARQQVTYRLDRAHEMTVPLADRFRRAFGAEAAIGVVVLALSGLMLGLTPAKVDPLSGENYGPAIPFVDATTQLDARLFIGPARVGLNGFKLEVDAPQEGISKLELRFIPPAGSNQPAILQPIPLQTAGTAYLKESNGLPFNVAGTWTVEFIVATATGSQPGAQIAFEVAPAEGGATAATTTTVAGVPAAPVVSQIGQPTPSASFATTTAAPTLPPTTTLPPG